MPLSFIYLLSYYITRLRWGFRLRWISFGHFFSWIEKVTKKIKADANSTNGHFTVQDLFISLCSPRSTPGTHFSSIRLIASNTGSLLSCICQS